MCFHGGGTVWFLRRDPNPGPSSTECTRPSRRDPRSLRGDDVTVQRDEARLCGLLTGADTGDLSFRQNYSKLSPVNPNRWARAGSPGGPFYRKAAAKASIWGLTAHS